MKATGPKSNSCVLSVADVQWIYNNIQNPAIDVVTGLASRRFKNPALVLSSDKAVIEFIQGCTQSCECEFISDEQDKQQYERLCSYTSELNNLKEVLSTFQLLWRGFSHFEIENAVSELGRERESYERDIAICLKSNGIERGKISTVLNARKKNQQKKGAQRKKKRKYNAGPTWILERKLELLIQDRNAILEIRQELRSFFLLPEEEIAFQRLISETRRRRFPVHQTFWFEDDYTSIRPRLYFLRKQHLSFPLRFMEDMPARLYHNLFDLWEQGESKDDVVLAYRDYCEKSISSTFDVCERILQNYSVVKPLLPVDRTDSLREMSSCEEKGFYHAQVLLCATLLEGLIWDFAVCLNRRHYRVFKPLQGTWPRGKAYKWDKLTGKVVLRSGKGLVDNDSPLKTGRDVLGKTRLGHFLPEALNMYIISDFFDDRNCYAHANSARRNIKADATVMLLCVNYLIEKFRSVLIDRKILV